MRISTCYRRNLAIGRKVNKSKILGCLLPTPLSRAELARVIFTAYYDISSACNEVFSVLPFRLLAQNNLPVIATLLFFPPTKSITSKFSRRSSFWGWYTLSLENSPSCPRSFLPQAKNWRDTFSTCIFSEFASRKRTLERDFRLLCQVVALWTPLTTMPSFQSYF